MPLLNGSSRSSRLPYAEPVLFDVKDRAVSRLCVSDWVRAARLARLCMG